MFLKRDNPHTLVVSMTGEARRSRRASQVRPRRATGGRRGKVGLSGRAVAVVPDEASAERARKGAADAGSLVEVEVARTTSLPVEENGFDLAIVDDTGGLFGTMRAEDRAGSVRELLRVLRPGGRVMIIGGAPRGGLGALFSTTQVGPPFVASGDANKALEADGFKSVQTLADREGLVFVEAIKPREGK